MWRNIQVARPSCSTSAGQFSLKEELATAVETATAVPAAVIGLAEEALGDLEVSARCALDQDLKELQTLHGLPSGPRTRPGGRDLEPGSLGDTAIVVVGSKCWMTHPHV